MKKAYVLGLILAAVLFAVTPAHADVNVYTESGNYGSGATNDRYLPSGWMGDTGDLGLTDAASTNPHTGPTSTKVTYGAFGSYSGTQGWAGVYWQQPEGNWGSQPGLTITGADTLSFWARGAQGGEQVTFGAGGILGDPYSDTFKVFGDFTLTNSWQEYSFDLSGKNLSDVIGGFYFAASASDNPNGLEFYVDDVVYNGNVVPEPSSLLLLGSGVLGMLGISRKKKTA